MTAVVPTAPVRRTTIVGQPVRRLEDRRFLTGTAKYVADVRRPGALHLAFARSEVAHGRIVAVDVARARAAPGVVAVLTGRELIERVPPMTVHIDDPAYQRTEYPALAVDTVRFAGEAVAAVLAEDRYLAEDAVGEIDVRYERLPPVLSVAQALAPDAPRLHEGWTSNVIMSRSFRGGDTETAFAQADGVLALDLVTRRQAAAPIETRGCVAEFDAGERTLTVWMSTQSPHIMRSGLATLLDLPENRVRVISPDVGGAFGLKNQLYPEDLVTAVLAIRTGRPVRWIEDRREHLLASNHARQHEHELEVAYRHDGCVLGVRARIHVDAGAYSMYPWAGTQDATMALGILPGPYRIRNYDCDAATVATNKSPHGAYRAVGRPAACFSIERALDAVAAATGLDPVEVRRRNLVRPDELPYESVTGMAYDSGSFVEALERACEVADYAGLRVERARAREVGRLVGIGVACQTEQTAHTGREFAKRGVAIVPGYDAVALKVDPSGTVTVRTGSHSHGQGHETTIAQVVADELTLPLERVRVEFGDTATAPHGPGTFASRTAVLSGEAAARAATAIRGTLIELAAHLLEASPDDLELAAGKVGRHGGADGIAFEQLARWVYQRPDMLPDGLPPNLEAVGTCSGGPGSGTFANAAQVALVEVDPDTGVVDILRYVVVADSGQPINPMIVEGQVVGGIAQGIGGALLEELTYDELGTPLATSLGEYRIPGAPDVPRIEVEHLVTPSPFTYRGIKGVGEGGAIGPGPLLAAAVEDALAPLGDVRVRELPITPRRVRALIDALDTESEERSQR